MYAYKEKYTLDFSKIQHWNEFHQIIKQELDFPDYYGENWDAFWDCITDMVDGRRILYIEIIGAEVLQQKYLDDFNFLLKCLRDAKHLYNDKFYDYVKIEIVCGEARYEIT